MAIVNHKVNLIEPLEVSRKNYIYKLFLNFIKKIGRDYSINVLDLYHFGKESMWKFFKFQMLYDVSTWTASQIQTLIHLFGGA